MSLYIPGLQISTLPISIEQRQASTSYIRYTKTVLLDDAFSPKTHLKSAWPAANAWGPSTALSTLLVAFLRPLYPWMCQIWHGPADIIGTHNWNPALTALRILRYISWEWVSIMVWAAILGACWESAGRILAAAGYMHVWCLIAVTGPNWNPTICYCYKEINRKHSH